MADLPFLDFPEEHPNDVVEDEEEKFTLTLDSLPYWSHIPDFTSDDVVFSGSNPLDRKNNQVTFVMDLFHQRVEQSDSIGYINGSGLEFIEDDDDDCEDGSDLELGLGFGDGSQFDGPNGNGSISELGLGLGLGLGFGDGIQFDDEGSDDEDDEGDCDDDCYCDCDDHESELDDSGEEFVVANGDDGNRSGILRMGGIRVVEIDSDSDSDLGDDDGLLLGIDLQSEDDDYAAENLNEDEIDIPLCWDSFQLEDHTELNNHNNINNDFEWEEVYDHDDSVRVDNREILSFIAEPDPDDEEVSVSLESILPISGPDNEEQVISQRGLEWEMLMSVERNNLELDPESDPGPYFSDHDDNSYTTEYELMFGPLADGENPLLARPPAAKSVILKLPSVVITKEDVENERALCAVCKDQMEVNEEVKKLPCCHWYHGECILPWLGIRNTCPVCRYELPTDDPDYEQRRAMRGARNPVM